MAIVKIDELVFDKDIYPRKKTSWVTAMDYAQSMKTGAKFPPIAVAKFKGKSYVVDGWHRVQGYKRNDVEYTDAEMVKVNNKTEMFLEAINRNITHGRQFSFQEKVILIDKLEKLKVDNATISKTLGMTVGKIEKFKIERITHTVSGKTIVLKSPMKHMAERQIENGMAEVQEEITGVRSQIQLLDMVIDMVRSGSFDASNKDVTNKLEELHGILDKSLVKS